MITRVLTATVALLLTGSSLAVAESGPRWRTSWAQSQQALSTPALHEESVRMIAHLSQGGPALRVRVQNQFGAAPLTIDAAAAGLSAGSGAVKPGGKPVLFGGQTGVTIPVGGDVWSDPVRLSTQPQDDVAVSLYVRGPAQPSGHQTALRDNYLAPGNRVGDPAPYPRKTGATYLISAVEVLTAVPRTIVGFGSSVVDGHGSTVCGPGCTANGNNRRWLDDLGRRAKELPRDQRFTVANAGIGGTTSAATCPGTPPAVAGLHAAARLDRDVLALPGVTDVIYYYGTNDLAFGCRAADILASYRAVFPRLRAAGIRVHVSPITPRPSYTAQQNRDRAEVNAFVRAGGNCGGACDGVVDFDAVLRDPANPNGIRAEFDAGDGIHASQAGQAAMAASVKLPL